MKLLFDHCVPKPFRRTLPSHEIRTAAQMGWENLRNGRLLAEAASAFDVFLTVDQNIEFQQNMDTLPIAVIVLATVANTPEALLPFAPHVESVLRTIRPGQMIVIESSGKITAINAGREQ